MRLCILAVSSHLIFNKIMQRMEGRIYVVSNLGKGIKNPLEFPRNTEYKIVKSLAS